jgi:predicted RNA-binding Zn-ribbon protein involved in translation (DUF1610 family)
VVAAPTCDTCQHQMEETGRAVPPWYACPWCGVDG